MVGSSFGGDIDHRAAINANLTAVRVSLDLKLADHVDRGAEAHIGPAVVSSFDSVDDVVDAAFSLSTYPNALIVSYGEVRGVGLEPLAAAKDDTGGRGGQREIAPSVDGKFLNAPISTTSESS